MRHSKHNLAKQIGSLCMGAMLLLLGFSMAFPPSEAATLSGVGYHGAPFLKISPAARQVALADAFTALSDDINMMRYNVGGLGGLNYTSFAVNFNTWIDDTQQGNLAFGMPFSFGTLAADLTYFNEGKIVQLDEDFNPAGGNGVSGDILFSLGYGYAFDNLFQVEDLRLGLGVAGKYLNQSLVGVKSTVYGLDAGVHLQLPQYISLGAAVQNYGLTKVQFDSWESPLPETYRAGAALTFPFISSRGSYSHVLLSSDASWTTKEEIRYYVGSEVLISEVFALRGGYKFNDPSISNWALGFGLNIPASWLARSNMRFDYAYAPLDAFESAAHRFSLHFTFGSVEEGVTAASAQEVAEMSDKLRRELEEAERARIAAQEAEARLRALEEEMQRRLEQIQRIADESEGKIEILAPTDEGIPFRVFFDFDKYDIKPTEVPTLERVGQILNTYPEYKVHLSGHTDWIGTEEYNIHLSQRRLNSVMNYLVGDEDVQRSRFYYPVGYGESKPIASNETEEGRAKNRRVEFLIITAEDTPQVPQGTAILGVEAVDENTVRIVANGKIPVGEDMLLSNPDRYVLDFNDIFLLAEDKVIPLNRGPFIQTRLGYHGSDGAEQRYTRVVLDLQQPIAATLSSEANYIYIRLAPKLQQRFEKIE